MDKLDINLDVDFLKELINFYYTEKLNKEIIEIKINTLSDIEIIYKED